MLGCVLGDVGENDWFCRIKRLNFTFLLPVRTLLTYIFRGNTSGPLLFPRRHSRFLGTEREFGGHPVFPHTRPSKND